MDIKQEIRQFLRKNGYDIVRFAPASHPLARRKQIFEAYRIDTVLDVGANSGQYGKQLRKDIGYKGRILSFEPVRKAFKQLEDSARNDPRWEIFNWALGDSYSRQQINVAGNSYSSSLLDMLPSHVSSAPDSKYVGKETIDIKTLDSLFGDLCKANTNVYMKLDVQGFESAVLKGAQQSLARIGTVQMEMSLIPLYEGEMLFTAMIALMNTLGYTLVAIENGFSDPTTGQLLQIDGIFHRL